MVRIASAVAVAAMFGFAQDAALHWIPVTSPKIDVAGLPWFQQDHGQFWRLPDNDHEAFPQQVWNLAHDPAGGRIRFRTDSSSVALHLEWPHPPGNFACLGATT